MSHLNVDLGKDVVIADSVSRCRCSSVVTTFIGLDSGDGVESKLPAIVKVIRLESPGTNPTTLS